MKLDVKLLNQKKRRESLSVVLKRDGYIRHVDHERNVEDREDRVDDYVQYCITDEIIGTAWDGCPITQDEVEKKASWQI